MPVMLSVAVDEALAEQIELLSRDTGRSVEELHQVALAQFLREEREHVDAGWSAGRGPGFGDFARRGEGVDRIAGGALG